MMHSSPAPTSQLPTSPMSRGSRSSIASKQPASNSQTPPASGVAPNDPRLASFRQSPSTGSSSRSSTSKPTSSHSQAQLAGGVTPNDPRLASFRQSPSTSTSIRGSGSSSSSSSSISTMGTTHSTMSRTIPIAPPAANINFVRQPPVALQQAPPMQKMRVKHRPKKNTRRFDETTDDFDNKPANNTTSGTIVEPSPQQAPTVAAATIPNASPKPPRDTTKQAGAQPVQAPQKKHSPPPFASSTPMAINRRAIILDTLPDVKDVSKSLAGEMSPQPKYSDGILSAVGLQATPTLTKPIIITSTTNSDSRKSVSEQSDRTKQQLLPNNKTTQVSTPKTTPKQPTSPAYVGAHRSTFEGAPRATYVGAHRSTFKETPISTAKKTSNGSRTPKVQGSISTTADPKPFDWNIYLEASPGEIAPKEAFNQSIRPLENKFLAGMKLEAKDPRSSGWALATVIWSQGLRIRLRFDGGDHMNDFYELVDSENIRPVGSAPGEILFAPVGFKQDLSRYPSFVEKTLTAENVTIAAPEYFYQKPEPPQRNLFRKGMKLEAVDRKNAYLICPATVFDVRDRVIEIKFDGWENAFGYKCGFDSRDLFPVNWCSQTNYPITPPYGWDIILESRTNLPLDHAKQIRDNVMDSQPDLTSKASKMWHRKRIKVGETE